MDTAQIQRRYSAEKTNTVYRRGSGWGRAGAACPGRAARRGTLARGRRRCHARGARYEGVCVKTGHMHMLRCCTRMRHAAMAHEL
eukprot:4656654-Prymnesium_polylepis.1